MNDASPQHIPSKDEENVKGSALCKSHKRFSDIFWSQRLTDLCELPESTGDGTGTISDRSTCHSSFLQ